MKAYLLSLLVIWSLPLVQAAFTASLDAPSDGEALQGLVAVEGNTQVDGFQGYRVEFSAEDNGAPAWFLIAESDQAVRNGVLAEWDTSALSDGQYALRLTVSIADADPEIRETHGLRIRNYTVIETNTPAPSATLDPEETTTPTFTALPPTATPWLENPMSLSAGSWARSIRWGIILAFVSLGLLGLYSRRRR